MATYAIDSTRQAFLQTGIREPVMEWEDRAGGGRRPSDRQARDEDTGLPLWGVEVLYQRSSYGRVSTVTAKVTVPALDEPTGLPLTPIAFDGLTVDVRVTKAGALVETWRADTITTAPTNTTTGTVGGSSGSGTGPVETSSAPAAGDAQKATGSRTTRASGSGGSR